MRRLLVIAAVVALLPSTAFAGTITATRCPSYARECSQVATYAAAPGERIDVTFSRDAQGVIVRDAGALVTPGRGCVALDPFAARCSAWDLALELGDGDDRAAPAGPHVGLVSVSAGPGDDYVTGGESRNWFDGGEGADSLLGGAGNDMLIGGAGSDVLNGAGGIDTMSYVDGPPSWST